MSEATVHELSGQKNRWACETLSEALAEVEADPDMTQVVVVVGGVDRHIRFHRGGCTFLEGLGLLHLGVDAALKGIE